MKIEIVRDEDLGVISFYLEGEKVGMIIDGHVVFEHRLAKYKFMIWLPAGDPYHIPRA